MASAATDSVGLVGLGIMGGAITARLLAQGIPLTVFDVAVGGELLHHRALGVSEGGLRTCSSTGSERGVRLRTAA